VSLPTHFSTRPCAFSAWFERSPSTKRQKGAPHFALHCPAAHSALTQLQAIGAPSAFAHPSASLTLPTCALYHSAVGGVKAEDCTATSTDATCVACQASLISFVLSCSSPTAGQACPDGVQDTIDSTYSECDGLTFVDPQGNAGATWDSQKAGVKVGAEACGCGGAAQAAPALFVALAAVANHFLA
jgi:hypothetical protein